ncbi:SecY-interacting protein Syd [Gemmata sp. JC673]|uniref:SecY-interacting protein Syd n=1 Tax=Gemmata algarum TaxID=2975278 RepID=A0ABU5ETY6_9BACT|nr:SecY-interacting protein Syd [Gemmata algarum]MDY3558556.1 SecY-interacting protein Syd [Gemmata algarum]
MGEVAEALLRLLNRASQLRIEYDPTQPSPCVQLPPDHHDMVEWRPVPASPPAALDGVAVHPSVREFYGSYLGWEAGGRYAGEAVHLIVVRNDELSEQFGRTLRRQVDAGEPVMVAYTDREQLYSVDSAAGAVWLCASDHQPIRQVAPTLAAFLADIE